MRMRTTTTSSPPMRTPRWTAKQMHPCRVWYRWMTDYSIMVMWIMTKPFTGSWASFERDPSTSG